MRKITSKIPFQSSPPVVLGLPTISGPPQVGQTLTASTGTWTHNRTLFTYRWQNEGSPISGATNSTYVLQTSDLGAIITVKVIATNGIGASLPATRYLGGLIKIMPLGDSITQGYSPLGSPGGYRAPLWTALQNDGYNIAYVGSASDNGASGLPFSNHEGHGGYTISAAPDATNPPKDIQYGIDNLGWLNANPDIILLLVGINDFFPSVNFPTGRTTAQANADYSALLDDILLKLPDVKIICSSLVQNNGWVNTFNTNLSALVATKGPRVSFVDMHAAGITLSTDNTHPSQLGYTQMAPVWKAGVEAIAPLALGPVINTRAFYVSSSTGLDTNAGTQAAPWQTLAKVNAQTFAPATSVLFKRGDKWDRTAGPSVSGQLNPAFTSSGTTGNPIVYDAYGIGPNPIIDGAADASHTTDWTNIGTNLWRSVQTFAPATTTVVTITIASPAVVTWGVNGPGNGQSIIFATTGALPTGIVAGTIYYVVGASGNTFNISATFGGAAINATGSQSGTQTAGANGLPYHNANDIGNLIWGFAPLGGSAPAAVMSASYGTMKGGGTGGIWFTPGSGTTNIAGTSQGTWQFNTDNFKVEVFSIGNPATAMPGLRLAMNADGMYIHAGVNAYNIIQNITCQNMAAIGSVVLSSNVTIRDCVFQNIGGGNNGGASSANSRLGDGFNLNGTASNILVERNFFYNMYDTGIAPQNTGANSTRDNVIIRNNITYLCAGLMTVLNNPGSGVNILSNMNIYNNTNYGTPSWSNNQRPNPPSPNNPFVLFWDNTVTVTGLAITNNVYAGYQGQIFVKSFMGQALTGSTGTVLDYNIWFTSNASTPQYNYTSNTVTMAVWRAGFGFETHGLIQVDPLLTNPAAGNFTPAPSSPLRNAGPNLYSAGVVWDFNKKPRPVSGAFTIGALQ